MKGAAIIQPNNCEKVPTERLMPTHELNDTQILNFLKTLQVKEDSN